MADRIKGISVEIGGDTKGLSKALSNVNKEISTTQKDLKDVERLLKLDPGNTELLRQKYDLLNKSIESTETKLDSLKDAEKQVQAQFQRGDIGEDQYNALKREVIETEAKLGKLRSEAQNSDNAIREIDEKPIKEVAKAADDAGDSLQEAGKEASNFGDFLNANAIVEGSKAITSSLQNIAEESKEYMKIMGSLEISSQNAGYTADQTAQSYKTLYGVLADEQTAATTTANLQAIGLSQQQLGQVINGTIGAWATYGDSIPIDGLAEAINETVKTGNVTGTFADVLNWAGSSEDTFNKKLQSTNSESKRANLILQELANQGLIQAGEAWQENNKALVENNKANADYQESIAKLSETVMPIMTAATQAVTNLINFILDNKDLVVAALTAIGAGLAIFKISGIISTLVAGFKTFFSVIKSGQGIMAALNAVMNANPIFLIISAIAALVAAFIYLWNNCEEFREFWINLWNGIKDFFISAWEGIKAFFTETIPNMFNDLVNWFKELPGRIWEWLVSVVQSIIQWIVDLNTTVNEGISNFISGIVDWFAQLPGRIWEWLVNVVQSVLQWIVDMNKKVNDGIKNMIDGIINWFKELPGRIWDWLVNVVKNIAKWVIDMNKKASDGIREFVDTIINKVKELPGKFLEWGKDMIQNFINGIKSMIGKLGDAVGNIAGTIASFLHFSVPDEGPLVDQPKWMPDMIDNMIQGINQNKHKLVEAMDNMAFDMSGSMMVSPAGNGYGTNSTTTNTTNNSFGGMTVNVYSNGDMAQTAEQIAAEIQQAAMRKGMVFA